MRAQPPPFIGAQKVRPELIDAPPPPLATRRWSGADRLAGEASGGRFIFGRRTDWLGCQPERQQVVVRGRAAGRASARARGARRLPACSLGRRLMPN